MRFIVLILFGLLTIPLFAVVQADTTQGTDLYLPVLYGPDKEIGIENASFEDGWTDLPPAPGNLINQEPNGWNISFQPIGENLFEFGEPSNGIPESIHKIAFQLPPHERAICGEPNSPDPPNCCDSTTQTCTPLILDGEHVYKTFHGGASFGTTFTQTLDAIPSQVLTVTVPIQTHDQSGGSNTFDAGIRVSLGDQTTDWIWLDQLGDRSWFMAEVNYLPITDKAELRIDVVNRYDKPRDFFIDNITIE